MQNKLEHKLQQLDLAKNENFAPHKKQFIVVDSKTEFSLSESELLFWFIFTIPNSESHSILLENIFLINYFIHLNFIYF